MKKCMKLKHLNKIKTLIIKALDEDQEIKRYCTYYTTTPTLSMGEDYNGNMINQPDVTKSLLRDNIFPYMFYEDLLKENRIFIFCYPKTGRLKNIADKNTFYIDVVAPVELNFLKDLGDERILCVADRITDVLDGDKIGKSIKEVEFTQYNVWRVYKGNNYMGITLQLEIVTSNMGDLC